MVLAIFEETLLLLMYLCISSQLKHFRLQATYKLKDLTFLSADFVFYVSTAARAHSNYLLLLCTLYSIFCRIKHSCGTLL